MNFIQKFFKILQLFYRKVFNLIINLKSNVFKYVFIKNAIFGETLFLDEKINSEIASENFQNLFSFYGLNSSKSLISTNKR